MENKDSYLLRHSKRQHDGRAAHWLEYDELPTEWIYLNFEYMLIDPDTKPILKPDVKKNVGGRRTEAKQE